MVLRGYLASPERGKIGFCVILHNTIGLAEDDWRQERARLVQFDSLSSYVWIHHFPEKLHTFPATSFQRVRDVNVKYWKETSRKFNIPYFPNVSMGWDASPRCLQTDAFENRAYPFMSTIKDNTPANFRRALELAKHHVDTHPLPTPHISINSWNEWTEGSYLEPDTKNQYAYLEAVRSVFSGR